MRLGDLDRVRLVVNGAGPYAPDQVREVLEFERADRVDQLPADPRAAASLVDGAAGHRVRAAPHPAPAGGRQSWPTGSVAQVAASTTADLAPAGREES